MNVQQLINALIARLIETSPERSGTCSIGHVHHWNSCKAWTIYTLQVAYGLDEASAELAIERALTAAYDRLLTV